MLYSGINLFAWYSTHLFFRDITVVNKQNVPKDGPTIIYGNHNNQFVDGMLLMNVINRPISFIAAAKSCRRTFLGPVIRGTGAIPVERPQDLAFKGEGKIVEISGKLVKGRGTAFTKLTKGCSLELSTKEELFVLQIINDEEIRTSSEVLNFQNGDKSYKVIPKLEYNQLYSKVWENLNNGSCIGIYPEGGSHDRLELLPLKAGICIMALGAMQKYNISVKLVPCGFNYYNPQQFRSKAVLEFGPAYEIPIQMIELYRRDKRKAIAILLENVEKMLKAVTIQFKSYNEINALFMARELYAVSGKREISIKQKLQLNRRFAKGYTMTMQNPQYKQVHQRLLKFSEFVAFTGLPIRREDFFGNKFIDFIKFLFYLQKCLVRSLALPGIIMFAPTTSLIAYLSQKERIKCLKGSKVKHYGNDVVGSYKIMLSSFLLPLTCAVHSVILYCALRRFTKLAPKTTVKLALGLFALQPIYALLFVKSYDSFKRSWKKLRFMFLRMFKPNIYTEFNREKKEIQKKIIEMVNKLGEEVVENFKDNRVLKKEEVQLSESQLFIFDEESG